MAGGRSMSRLRRERTINALICKRDRHPYVGAFMSEIVLRVDDAEQVLAAIAADEQERPRQRQAAATLARELARWRRFTELAELYARPAPTFAETT